jgi:hypothetical protein
VVGLTMPEKLPNALKSATAEILRSFWRTQKTSVWGNGNAAKESNMWPTLIDPNLND